MYPNQKKCPGFQEKQKDFIHTDINLDDDIVNQDWLHNKKEREETSRARGGR